MISEGPLCPDGLQLWGCDRGSLKHRCDGAPELGSCCELSLVRTLKWRHGLPGGPSVWSPGSSGWPSPRRPQGGAHYIDSLPGSPDMPAAGSPILHPEGVGRGRSSGTRHRNLTDKPKYCSVNLQVEFSTHVGVSTYPSGKGAKWRPFFPAGCGSGYSQQGQGDHLSHTWMVLPVRLESLQSIDAISYFSNLNRDDLSYTVNEYSSSATLMQVPW